MAARRWTQPPLRHSPPLLRHRPSPLRAPQQRASVPGPTTSPGPASWPRRAVAYGLLNPGDSDGSDTRGYCPSGGRSLSRPGASASISMPPPVTATDGGPGPVEPEQLHSPASDAGPSLGGTPRSAVDASPRFVPIRRGPARPPPPAMLGGSPSLCLISRQSRSEAATWRTLVGPASSSPHLPPAPLRPHFSSSSVALATVPTARLLGLSSSDNVLGNGVRRRKSLSPRTSVLGRRSPSRPAVVTG